VFVLKGSLRIVSVNVRRSCGGMWGVGSREEEVNVFLFQDILVVGREKTVELEGYESVNSIGGYLESGQGAAVSILVSKGWEGKWNVVVRERVRIGLVFKMREERLEVWNMYMGQGKYMMFKWVEGEGNGVVIGDINAWSKM